MKTLKGMKSFSTLENKKLVGLKSIQGGGGSASMETSNAWGAGSDTDYYSDASGSWVFMGRLRNHQS